MGATEEKIARFIVETREGEIPPEAIQSAKLGAFDYNLATAMIDRQIGIDSFTDEKLRRPEYRRALSKLTIHLVSPLDPDAKPSVREYPLTITLKDGRRFRKSTNHGTMHGSPADPLTDGELWGKFKANAALSLPASSVDRACELWWNIDTMADIRAGIRTVAGGTAAA